MCIILLVCLLVGADWFSTLVWFILWVEPEFTCEGEKVENYGNRCSYLIKSHQSFCTLGGLGGWLLIWECRVMLATDFSSGICNFEGILVPIYHMHYIYSLSKKGDGFSVNLSCPQSWRWDDTSVNIVSITWCLQLQGIMKTLVCLLWCYNISCLENLHSNGSDCKVKSID